MKRVASFFLLFAMAVPACAQNAVTYWNDVAFGVIVARGKQGPGPAAVYFTYANIAAFDAVNAIEPRFQAFGNPPIQPAAAAGASEAAAVAAAVHDVLVHYFPAQAGPVGTFIGLDATLTNYLAGLSETPAAVANGATIGHAVALAWISQRTGDGFFGVNNYVFATPAPGVYQPTPPFPYVGPQVPWMANMRPFTMTSSSQFLPDEGPSPLDSTEWADDYNQVKAVGAFNSTVRTPAQSEQALFWTASSGQTYGSLLEDLQSRYQIGILDTSRLFAMAWTAGADGFIGCINAKYHFNFWRPVTAIREGDTDGNPDTTVDTTWTPLVATPTHPEYPSAHGCVTGGVTEVIARYFGPNVPLHVIATYNVPAGVNGLTAGPTTTTRTFGSAKNLLTDVEYARIYAGIHYHHSVIQGAVLGQKVGRQVVKDYFQRVR